MELKGCAAIVTGGSGGLGQRICRALALNGVNVVVNWNHILTTILTGTFNCIKAVAPLMKAQGQDLLKRIADGRPGISGPRIPKNWSRADYCPR